MIDFYSETNICFLFVSLIKILEKTLKNWVSEEFQSWYFSRNKVFSG